MFNVQRFSCRLGFLCRLGTLRRFGRLTGQPRLTRAADSIDIQRKTVLAETLRTQTANHLINLWRLHLRHLATQCAYLVTVTIVVVTSLVLRGRLKTVSHHQSQFNEELQRVIQRSPAHGKVILLGKLLAQLLKREMLLRAIYCIQYGKPLRSLPVLVQFQIARQYVFDGYFDVFFHSYVVKWVKNRRQRYSFFSTYSQHYL